MWWPNTLLCDVRVVHYCSINQHFLIDINYFKKNRVKKKFTFRIKLKSGKKDGRLSNEFVGEKVNGVLARAVSVEGWEDKSGRLIVLQIISTPWTFFDMQTEKHLQVSSCSFHTAVQIGSIWIWITKLHLPEKIKK